MDPLLGEVRRFAFGFVPQGWAACDGSMLSINDNTALFSLLGTSFGGNGQTNFALPTIAPEAGLAACIATAGVYPSRP
jgi:microcystin-dependent protein